MITSRIYETRPFMVSRKIKLQWNVLKIDIGVRFQSHKDYIRTTVYFNKISCGCNQVIKLHCGENRSRIEATKMDLWSLIEKKKQYEWTDNGHWRSCTQNYAPGEDVVLCTGYFSPVFSKISNVFSCGNVGKKLSHVEVTRSCFEVLVAVCYLLTTCLAVFWHC